MKASLSLSLSTSILFPVCIFDIVNNFFPFMLNICNGKFGVAEVFTFSDFLLSRDFFAAFCTHFTIIMGLIHLWVFFSTHTIKLWWCVQFNYMRESMSLCETDICKCFIIYLPINDSLSSFQTRIKLKNRKSIDESKIEQQQQSHCKIAFTFTFDSNRTESTQFDSIRYLQV